MKNFSRAICLFWLIALWALSTFAPSIAAPALSPAQAPFAYDGQNQARVAYDGASQPVSNYDSAAVPSGNDKENRTVGASGLFAKLAKYLAAEGTVGKTIGLGLDEDLFILRGAGAVTYKNGGWQQAGLTTGKGVIRPK